MSAQQPPPVPDDPPPAVDPWSAEASTEIWSPPSPYPPPAYTDPTAPPVHPASAAPPVHPASAAPPVYPAPAAPPVYPAPAAAPAPPAYPAPAPARPVYPAPVSAYLPPSATGVPPAPYAYPPAPGHARSLRGPAILATTGLGLSLVSSLVLESLTRSRALLDGDGLGIVSLGVLGVFVFTVVAFLSWLHRASTNLWNTGHRLKWRPGWTVGAWLIPVANLVLPLLVFREIDRESRDHGSGLFAVWAVAWTLDILLDSYHGDVTRSGDAHALSLISTPVAAVAAILLVRRITADQERLVQPSPF
ncbi:DUF4328 domain-containing protein [Actinoplanes oblitus]|uniref:DUF4328 domain-containing protein n=1 Tax=Actinoplanes oblitus TaxID=3040509 RepID=A0ABY8WFK2_9ACTN|nr:DUF4328 domain-containing protein [Actinoplanes oblitus]WIM95853.1 DUF4328 domain-containing protein [Actinoplanes oblitus]